MKELHTGRKFGKLLILAYTGKNPKSQWIVLVKCDCGEIKKVLLHRITSYPLQRNCGCGQAEARKRYAGFNIFAKPQTKKPYKGGIG